MPRLMMPWRAAPRSAPKGGALPPSAGSVERYYGSPKGPSAQDVEEMRANPDPFGRSYEGEFPSRVPDTFRIGDPVSGENDEAVFLNYQGWAEIRSCGGANVFISPTAPAVQCGDGRIDPAQPATGTETTIGGWEPFLQTLPPVGANMHPGTSWGRSGAVPAAPTQIRLPAVTVLPRVVSPEARSPARSQAKAAPAVALPDEALERSRARSRLVGTYQLAQALRRGDAVAAQLFVVMPQRRVDRARAVAAAVKAGEIAPRRGAIALPSVAIPEERMRTPPIAIPDVGTAQPGEVARPSTPGAVAAARITRHRAAVYARAVSEATTATPAQTHEVKLAFRQATTVARVVGYNITTEFRDVVDALWKNLRPECKQYANKGALKGKNWRKKRDKFQPTRFVGRLNQKGGGPTLSKKVKDVMNHLDCINWSPWYDGLKYQRGAGIDLALNQVEDALYGGLGMAMRKATKRGGYTAGLQMGDGLENSKNFSELGGGSPVDRIADAIGI